MTAAPLIRPFRAEDCEAVAALAVEMALDLDDPPPSNSPELLQAVALSADPWCEILVAELAGEVVGFAALDRRFDLHTASRVLYLSDLHVARRARRRGVARALMAAVGRHAAALGCAKVTWQLWTLNDRGAAFYRSIGADWDEEALVLVAPPQRLADLGAPAD